MGASAVFSVADRLKQSRPRWSRAVPVAVAVLIIAPTMFYAVAFVNVYAQQHPWIQVSEWMYRNLPANSVIATEHWDDRLPLSMTIDKVSRNAESYGHKDMANYEEDNVTKLNWMVDNIRASNVIVLSTNRLYGSIARLPDRYPLTTAYYQLLFSEQLGFKLTAFAATYPSLLGVTLVDDTFSDPLLPVPPLLAAYQPSPITLNLGRADESFTVYDHPKPLVFQKTSQLSAEELRALFEPAMRRVDELRQQRLAQEAAARAPQSGGTGGKTLLLSEEDRAVEEAGGTFADMFDPASLSNRMPVAFWWLVIMVLGWLAFPVTFGLLRTLDDRGLFVAKALGILLLGYVVWLAASLRVLPYTQVTIWLAMAAFAAVSGVLYWRQRVAIREFLRQRRNLVFASEAVFLVAYLAFCAIRTLNPDLWQPWQGGEKPMEFAFLNAIIRSTYFPPFDPYFAGGTINYYYYGQYLVATLAKLSGILPAVAFNTAVPSLFALTFCGVAGVAYNLAPRNDGGQADGTGLGDGTRRRLGFGLLAGLFVTVAGNLNGLVQIMDGLSKNSTMTLKSVIPGLEGMVRLVTGAAATVAQRLPMTSFDYWRSTRLVPNTINEFPYFSFLFADLHAHMIGLPFTVLVLAIALNLARERRDSVGGSSLAAAVLRLVVLAVCVGALAATNSWDLPTYLGILLCALVIRDWAEERRVRVVRTLARFGLMALLSVLLYWPFFQNYQALYLGLDVTSFKTSLADYWQLFGFFLFLIVAFLLAETASGDGKRARLLRLTLRRWDRLPRLRRLIADVSETPVEKVAEDAEASEPADAPAPRPERPLPWGLWITGWTAVVSITLVVAGFPLLAALVPVVVLAACLALRRGMSPEQLFTLLLVFTAALISLGVEIVYLRDFLGGGDYQRMNTLFKFYMQVWVFYGIAAAVALARLTRREAQPARPGAGLASPWLKAVWWFGFSVLLLAVMVYPVAGTAARVSDRFPGARPEIGTLDGMAFMMVGSYTWENRTIELKYDYEAIQWLLWNVRGSPVVAEAAIGYYREFGVRVASFTGLPTLLGMHQSEQRYDFQVGARDGEARTFFSEADYARVVDLAKRLHIKYIYVGQLERIVYPAAGLAKFDRAVGTYLDVVYENARTKIYAVR
jgi:YYY domain-containing protein